MGSADFKKVCEYLENQFKKENKSLPEIKIKKISKETTEERPGIDQAHFIFAVHTPLKSSPEFPALEVLDAYLANGMSSRLFLEIREKRGLAYTVSSSISAEKSYSNYTIYTGTTKPSIPEIKKIILEEFKKIENMTEKDLEESKQRVIGLQKVSSEESVSVMSELLFSELSGKAEDYYAQEEKIKSITLQQVKSLAKSLIKSYSTASIVPR